ncbi:MAG: phosphomannomutase [Parcubacteria bacterium C7867-002]|nr:MAG: phosphomannomutase [Parcubacteria bacterium C7867-002]
MDFTQKDLVIFDLDGTLAPSKSAMDPEMGVLLVRLLQKKKVAIISGGGYPQFETQLLRMMPHSSEGLSNLFLLPTSGTRFLSWKGSWVEQYAENLSEREKKDILSNLDWAFKIAGYEKPSKTYGPAIEDRGSQITFSALGQEAPLDLKTAWDPDRSKRERIAVILREKIPAFDIRLGGTTSIDITRKGVNKAYGIRKLETFLSIPVQHMVFVGDALFHGGNDYPAKATGVDCIQVAGPEETKKLIQSWVA